MKRKAKTMGATLSSHSSHSAPPVTAASGPSEQFFPYPLEILEEIFLNLPAHEVVCLCRLVCRQWKEVADSESLWRERCRRERYHHRDESRIPDDWRLFYFLCKNRRNLLKNPIGEDKMNGWQVVDNGGDEWKIEDVMVPHPNEKVKRNFVTSYQLSIYQQWSRKYTAIALYGSFILYSNNPKTIGKSFSVVCSMCRKAQMIDLEKEGYNPSFMDQFQPDIRISDWYAPRWDCASEYTIAVQLLNHKKKIIKKFTPDTIYFEQWNDQQWNQITHVFKNYGPGVRYVRFTHGGKDCQFWAGWYGIRVTDSCVEICPAVDR